MKKNYPHKLKVKVAITTMSKGYIKNQLKRINATKINSEYDEALKKQLIKKTTFNILK